MNAAARAHFGRYALASGRHAPPGYRLEVLPHTTHMTLYSDQDKLAVAAGHAQRWFTETL